MSTVPPNTMAEEAEAPDSNTLDIMNNWGNLAFWAMVCTIIFVAAFQGISGFFAH